MDILGLKARRDEVMNLALSVSKLEERNVDDDVIEPGVVHRVPRAFADAYKHILVRIIALEKDAPALVECERCGCLLKKSRAYRGESVIDKEADMCRYTATEAMHGIPPKYIEGIRERYYCLVHKPKGKK